MRSLLVAAAVVALTVVAGCRPDGRPDDERLLAADSLMAIHADSAAYALLAKVDPQSVTGDANRAFYALSLTKALYKNYLPIASDSLAASAVDYYSGTSNSTLLLEARIFRGAALEESGKTMEAIEWYKEVEASIPQTDYSHLGYINLRLGDLYNTSYIEVEIPIERYKKALRYYQLAGNKKYQRACLSSIGSMYRLKNLDSAYAYLNRAIALAKELGEVKWMFVGQEMLSRAYIEDSLIEEGKNLAIYVINNGVNYLDDDRVYNNAAISYVALGMPDSAWYYLNLSKSEILSPEDKVRRLTTLTKLYLAQGDTGAAYRASTVSRHLADSIITSKNAAKLYELEQRFNKQLVEEENRRMKMERLILYAAIALLIALLWTLYRWRKRKRRETLALIEQLQGQVLNAEEELKGKISAESNVKAVLEAQIANIKELIAKSYNYEAKPSLFMKAFRESIKTSKQEKSAEFRRSLHTFVNLNYNNLISRIAHDHPNLDEDDLMIICLLRCGFSYVEIAICMGYENFDYVNTKKLRIAKKMGLSVSLRNFVLNFA